MVEEINTRSPLVVPPTIEAVIKRFDETKTPYTEHDVGTALAAARGSLDQLSEAENLGTWSEVLAFTLIDSRNAKSPWGTYFGPLGSGTDENGQTTYFPDVRDAPPEVIGHWIARAQETNHPVLKARYADLAWDMMKWLGGMRRDPAMANIAITSYLAATSNAISPELHDRFSAALRALDLACAIRDSAKLDSARAALLDLHREAISLGTGGWWHAFEALMFNKVAGATEEEQKELVETLENLICKFSKFSDRGNFNPHDTEGAAKRLIRYYTKIHKMDEVRRLWSIVALAFENFASIADPLVAASVLQTSVNSYRKAGQPEDSKRVRTIMENKISESRNHMTPIEVSYEIPLSKMEEFLELVVVDDIASTFVRITVEFLPKKTTLEKRLQDLAKAAPLMAHMPTSIVSGSHVAAIVGSLEDDPFGRLLQQATQNFVLSSLWLEQALERAVERHSLIPAHVVGWANRLKLFDDVTFLMEGVQAWWDGDFTKAAHVLIPQIESGLRSISSQLGKPTTKPHSTVPGVSVATSMGDILNSTRDIKEELGPDISLYFLALYADPRGFNLRNELAHGLIEPENITNHKIIWLIHSLLIFGIWDKLSSARR